MFTRRIKLHGRANTIRVYTSAFMYREERCNRHTNSHYAARNVHFALRHFDAHQLCSLIHYCLHQFIMCVAKQLLGLFQFILHRKK